MIGPDPSTIHDFDLDALTFFFQPVFRTEGGVGWFEALVRRRVGGIIQGPGGFLRAALASDRVGAFTELTIDRLFRSLGENAGVVLGLNLTPAQLLLPGTVARLCAADERERLVIEVTEQPINDPQALIRAVFDLRRCGIRVVFDDVTPRDAAARLLPGLELDGIKLDRDVIPWLLAGDRRVTGLVATARERGWEVTLEGIEDASLVERLTAIDCVQGFAFGVPGPLPRHGRIARATSVRSSEGVENAGKGAGIGIGWEG